MCNPFIWLSDKKKNDKLECKKELLDSKTVLILIFFLWIQVYNYFLAYMSSKFVFSERTMYVFVRFIVIYVYPKSLPQPPLSIWGFFHLLETILRNKDLPIYIDVYVNCIWTRRGLAVFETFLHDEISTIVLCLIIYYEQIHRHL